MTSSSPMLHLSESAPVLPHWPCRNRWSLSVCTICTSGTRSVRTSSTLTPRTWILAVTTLSAKPSFSLLVFVTKTGWLLWIKHPPVLYLLPAPGGWKYCSTCYYAILNTASLSNSGCFSAMVTESLLVSLCGNILVSTVQLHGSLGSNFPKLDDSFIAVSPSFSGFCFMQWDDCLMSQCPHFQLCCKDGSIVLSWDDHSLSMVLPWMSWSGCALPGHTIKFMVVHWWLLTVYGSSRSFVCLIPHEPSALLPQSVKV